MFLDILTGFISLWLILGVLGAFLCLYTDIKSHSGIIIQDIALTFILSFLGPFYLLFAIKLYIDELGR